MDFIFKRALFMSPDGLPLGKKNIPRSKLVFDYKGGSYNFIPDHSSYIQFDRWFWKTRYYFYDISNADPLILKSPVSVSAWNPETYNVQLKTKVIREINDLGKTSILDFLKDPKMLFLIILIIVAIVYFSKGGSLVS